MLSYSVHQLLRKKVTGLLKGSKRSGMGKEKPLFPHL